MGTLATTTASISAGLLLIVTAAVTAVASLIGGTASGLTGLPPSRTALADIPAPMLVLYQQAATTTCPGLPWTVLAAIGKAETDHGRNTDQVSTAGAIGPMQFEPATFTAYANPLPPGGKTPPTPWDPVDAVYAAAHLLCANGARDGRNLPAAIFAYNHDAAYVQQVERTTAMYAATPNTSAACGTFQPTLQPDSGRYGIAASVAVRYACAQLGQPYVWGGTGADDGGFDCSGLTQAAYAAAGIRLPRTAQDQYDTGPHLPAGAPLLPGDLVFYGTPAHVHHVGISTTAGLMIDAPHHGTPVRQEPIQQADFLGATRPTSGQRP